MAAMKAPGALAGVLASDMRAWLEVYPLVVQNMKKAEAGLPALDAWMLGLGAEVGARDQPHLSGAELSKLMKWKLTKGNFRPRLQQYADALDAEEVATVTQAAFKSLSKGARSGVPTGAAAKGALTQLTVFKGVGPATASALLAVVSPHIPFMGDEALEAALPKREYTPKAFEALTRALQGTAAAWRKEEGPAKDAATIWEPHSLQKLPWTAQLVQLALFAQGAAAKKLKCFSPQEVLDTFPPAATSKARGTKRGAAGAAGGSAGSSAAKSARRA